MMNTSLNQSNFTNPIDLASKDNNAPSTSSILLTDETVTRNIDVDIENLKIIIMICTAAIISSIFLFNLLFCICIRRFFLPNVYLNEWRKLKNEPQSLEDEGNKTPQIVNNNKNRHKSHSKTKTSKVNDNKQENKIEKNKSKDNLIENKDDKTKAIYQNNKDDNKQQVQPQLSTLNSNVSNIDQQMGNLLAFGVGEPETTEIRESLNLKQAASTGNADADSFLHEKSSSLRLDRK